MEIKEQKDLWLVKLFLSSFSLSSHLSGIGFQLCKTPILSSIFLVFLTKYREENPEGTNNRTESDETNWIKIKINKNFRKLLKHYMTKIKIKM